MCDGEVSPGLMISHETLPREGWRDPSDHKFIVSEMETIYKLISLLNSHKMLMAAEFVFHGLRCFLDIQQRNK